MNGMILGIDIGGTKTHIAAFDDKGQIYQEVRFKTPHQYDLFLNEIKEHAKDFENIESVSAIGVAAPGSINQELGEIVALGNLPWKNAPVVRDFTQIFGTNRIYIDNDANLAALAEARALPEVTPLVLYITLSTGIGSGIIVGNQLIPELSGSEAGQMMVRDDQGIMHRWETFASGRALVELTGQKAEDLTDQNMWKAYTRRVCMGLQPTISTLRPQIVVIGGGVGAHLERFQGELESQLEELNHSRTYTNPTIRKAHYGEGSVVYGCYEHAKDHLS